jgi:hypothetical protein
LGTLLSTTAPIGRSLPLSSLSRSLVESVDVLVVVVESDIAASLGVDVELTPVCAGTSVEVDVATDGVDVLVSRDVVDVVVLVVSVATVVDVPACAVRSDDVSANTKAGGLPMRNMSASAIAEENDRRRRIFECIIRFVKLVSSKTLSFVLRREGA